MVGYASSADDKLNCDEITVTVFPSGFFPHEHALSEFEVYSVNRDFTKVTKLKGISDAFSLPRRHFFKIAGLLHSEEIKNRCACRISWRTSPVSCAEKIKTELLQDVWFPAPVFVDHCETGCINITPLLFKDTPKPLEASMVCDVLNLLIVQTRLRLPHSFFNCMNSVYCSLDVLRVFVSLFGSDIPFSPDVASNLKRLNLKPPRLNVSEDILAPLSSLEFSSPSHSSTCLSLAIDAKRKYVSGLCSDFCRCIGTKDGWQTFLSALSHHAGDFSHTLTELAQVFVAGENISSISDIRYLTLYELYSAFAFFETRLSLKRMIAHSRLRQRILNRLKTPDFIDGVSDIKQKEFLL